MRRMRAGAVLFTLFLLLACAGQALASETPGSELTNAGGDLRTGWYPNEPSITPELLSGGTFGRVWSTPVKGQVYAQPLLDDGTLFVATESNNLYGLNPATGAQQWTKNLGEPWSPGEIGCQDLYPEVGVTSTPVIDPATNIAYVTYKTYREAKKEPEWFMDAVSVATGAQEPGFPVQLSGTAQNAPGREFHAQTQLQRPGLLLMEGVVYAAFGSDCDHPEWQGWVFGVSTEGAVKARWVSDETEEGAGIWQSGAGLTSDGPGTILLSTGNGGGPETPAPGDTLPPNLGESVVRLDVQPGGSLKAVDFFAPYNASFLDTWDADFASGGVTGLPEEAFGTHVFGTPAIPHLAVAVGKDGYVYLLNRDNLGGIAQGPAGSDNVVQRIGPYGGVWSRPGVWPGEGGWVYIPTASGGTSAGGSSGNLRVYQYGLSGSGMPTLSLQGTSKEAFGFSSSAPVITSNETNEGSALMWIVWAPNGGGEGAQLRAYAPVPVKGEPVLLWSGPIGTSAKFAIPGVGAGRLYVGTRDGHVIAFGSPVTPILSGSATTFPKTVDGTSSEKTVMLTATEPLTLSTLESSSSQFKLGTPSPSLPATLTTGQTVEVPITFAPTGTGPIGATLTATTSTKKTVTFGLSGTGQAAGPKLEATPPLVTFPGTIVGERESAGATFRNVGGSDLTINGVHLPAAPFAPSGVPAVGSTIKSGDSITITVTFEPSATGSFNDEIGLETTGGNQAVGLSGSASLPGTLEITNETVEYGQVQVGSSELESFTIKNTGGSAVPLTKSKPPIGGAFTATTSLPEGTTIEPGESVTEKVKFAPTSPGPAEGVWEINGEKDTNGLQKVHFKGEGVLPPALTPSTKSLNLGSTLVGGPLAGEVSFKNTGGTTLEVKGVSSPSAPFAATGLPATGTKLSPGETITVHVTFKSSTRGEFTGSLGLTTQAGETTVALAAFAEEPALTPSTNTLALGSVLVGKQTSGELTLKNTGNTTLEVKGQHTPSAPFAATGLPATGTKLKPGEIITVHVTFKPSAGGEFNGSLSVTTEAGETSVALTGFAEEPALTPSTPTLEVGSVLVGEPIGNEMTLKNTGNTTLEIKGVHAPTVPFAATGLPSNGTKIKPGETITVHVTFKPSARGEFTGSLSLTTQAGETTVSLTGFGEEPGLTPSTKSLNLGSVLVGKQTSSELTLKNTGTTTLEVKSQHAPSAPFAATGLPLNGSKLKPGETITVHVTFEPSAGGEFTGSLSVTTEAGETSVALTGFAEELALTPSTPTLEVGSVLVGEPIGNEMTLKNTGNTTLEIKGVHAPTVPFAATGLPSNGTKIKPGETITVHVTFKPSARGEFKSSLSLTTQVGETTVSLTGFGEEPGLTPSTKSLNLGSVLVGKQTSSELTLKNTGTTTLEVKSQHAPSAPFLATGLPATGTKIKPGETITVHVTFEPSAGGELTGSLSVTTEAGETTIALTGLAEEPALTPSTTTLEVGSVLIGKQISNELTLKNTGNTTLEIKSEHSPTAPFAATGLPSNGTKIKPGETIAVNVTFSPSAGGEFKASLSLTTQAGETIVTLTGFAQEPTTPAQTLPSTVAPPSGISPFVEAKEPAPTLTDLQVRAKSARSSPHLHKLLVSYDLSAANAVELEVERMTVSHHCSQGSRTCDHWSLTRVRSKVTGHAGANSLTLSLTGLSAGEYRLAATPIARSGALGTTHYLHFLTRG